MRSVLCSICHCTAEIYEMIPFHFFVCFTHLKLLSIQHLLEANNTGKLQLSWCESHSEMSIILWFRKASHMIGFKMIILSESFILYLKLSLFFSFCYKAQTQLLILQLCHIVVIDNLTDNQNLPFRFESSISTVGSKSIQPPWHFSYNKQVVQHCLLCLQY